MHGAGEEDDLIFDLSSVGGIGELVEVSPRIRRILAGNPGPMTFSGTCTYVVGRGDVAIVDPGPALSEHIAALLHALRHERVTYLLVTHTHRDHCAAAAALQAATGARIIGCGSHLARTLGRAGTVDEAHDPTYRPDVVLAEGDEISGRDFTLRAVATPGHTGNHMAFALAEEAALFSGDHVMAWASSVVIPPDGSMADYMASLAKLQQRIDAIYWPGHGPAVCAPQTHVSALMRHRRRREEAILVALGATAMTADDLVAQIYRDLDPALRAAARLSVLAHLEDLSARGLVVVDVATDASPQIYHRQ